MEARQRDAQMEEDRREKIEASKFKQHELNLKRDEVELSMARFELERKEREARTGGLEVGEEREGDYV